MPPPNRIAIVFDCDDTLAKDTTFWLLRKFGGDPNKIFREAADMISRGWDPPLAYLNIILKESKGKGSLSGFTLPKLVELAQDSEEIFFPGTTDLFKRLRLAVESEKRYQNLGIQVNFYIITGGIEEFVRKTKVGEAADEVWGSGFEYDDKGKPVAIKNAISFTEKTRYLFCINKGLTGEARNSPYVANTYLPDRVNRSVPFCNMIYVGDGPSDIPSMSVVMQYEGTAIGILGKKTQRLYELSFGRRAHFTIPPDYKEGSYGYVNLKNTVLKIAEGILKKWEFQMPPVPTYGIEGENNGNEVQSY